MPKWMLDLKTWGHLSREEYEELQNRKLRKFLTEQLCFSPYYWRFFDEHKIDPRKIWTTDDLAHIPFTSKVDIAPTLGTLDEMRRPQKFILAPDEDPKRFLAQVLPRWSKRRLLKLLGTFLLKGKTAVEEQLLWEYWPLKTVTTTGRTALNTSFSYTKRDVETFMEIGRRSFQLAKAPRKLKVINTFPAIPHLGFWSSVWFTYASGVYCLDLGGGPTIGTKRTIAALLVSGAQGLAATPDFACALFREILEEGIELPHLTRLGTGGERMSPGTREKLHRLMREINGGKETFIASTYGFTEAKEAWFECYETTRGGENTGFHLYPDLHFIELVNPQTGERVGEGQEGEIVYTPLDWRGTCVLRYRTGDVCQEGLTWEPCPHCGRTVPRLGPTIRRRSDLKEFNLTKIKATLVDTGVFAPILSALPEVLEWQVEARKEDKDDPQSRDQLVVHIAVESGVDLEDLKVRIARLIREETEVTPNVIEVHPLKKLEEMLGLGVKLKVDRFIDNRPKD